MVDAVQAVLRFPIVAFAFVVDLLRRIPGARQIERHATAIASAFLLAAAAVLIVWVTQKSPERVSIGDLAAGGLSDLQSWIIVSGNLSPDTSASDRRYILTDAAAPNAKLIVVSDVDLPLGQATISGDLAGGREAIPPGIPWVGMIRADPVLAQEPDPPWAMIVLVGAALFIIYAARTSYPVFFGQQVSPRVPVNATLEVAMRPAGEAPARHWAAGSLSIQRAAPVVLRMPGAAALRLRLHSARTNVEVGENRWLFRSEPALVVRPATGEMSLSFKSRDDRDAAFTALIADAERSQMIAAAVARGQRRPREGEPTGSARDELL